MYSVDRETRAGVELFSLRAGDAARAEIVPGWGCNCLLLAGREPVLEPVDLRAVAKRPTSFGIPILFPFPNRIRDGEFTFRGRRYRVDPKVHGFVRGKPWTVLGSGASPEDGAWLRCVLDARRFAGEILAQFPFPFEIEVAYRLKGARMEMETAVRNTGEADLPYGFGIHPYFRRPERGTVRVPARKRWELEDSLPTGKVLDVEGEYDLRAPVGLEGLVLDDLFTDLEADPDGLVRCVLADNESGTRTTIAFDRDDFPEVVVYTTPAPRRAIAIEPYTCPTDAFNLAARGVDAHRRVLEPGGSQRFRVAISF